MVGEVLNEVDIHKSSFIQPDLLAFPIHPDGPPTNNKIIPKINPGKTNMGGTTTPNAPTAYKTLFIFSIFILLTRRKATEALYIG